MTSPESQESSLTLTLTTPLESWEARARVAEGELATCNQELGLLTERLAEQEQQLQKDLVSRELELTALTEKVLAYKGRLEDKEQELANLKQEEQESQKAKDESEVLLQETREEKSQLNDQVTCVSLARVALEDEVGHLKEEVVKLRGEQEVAQLHVASITRGINQLISRLATREQEVTDMRLRAEFLEGEVTRLQGAVEDWRLKAAAGEGKVREMQEELALRQGTLVRARSEGSLKEARIQELSQLTDNLRKELMVEKSEARERLGKEVAISSELWVQIAKLKIRLEEVAEQKTARDSLALEVAGMKVDRLQEDPEGQDQELFAPACSSTSCDLLMMGEEATVVIYRDLQGTPSPSASQPGQARDASPPSASPTDSLQPSLKRPVDLETDFDYQKKARTNSSTDMRHLQVSRSMTGQGGGSSEVQNDMSKEVEGGEEREQVDSSNQYVRDLEEAPCSEQEVNSRESVAARTEEGAEAGSSPLQTLELVCDGCQSVFTRAASLRHHQAVAGRCRRVKELEPPEFVCHRCFKQFNSKSHLSKHVSFVLDCWNKKHQREGKVVEEVDLLEEEGPGEEMGLEAPAEVDSSLHAGSPQSLPGLEVTEAPVAVSLEGDHCYARPSTLIPEHRPSSHSSGQPVQVNSRLDILYSVNALYTPMGILSPLHSTKYKVVYEAGVQALYRICVSPSWTTGLHDV